MAGRNINMQISPLPEKQRSRKFANFKHGRFINPEEEDNEHEDDEHPEGDHGQPQPVGVGDGNGNENGNGAPQAAHEIG